MKVCASLIRDSFSKFDFYRNDKFCDAEDLKHSLLNMDIPNVTLDFFGEIYNFDPRNYNNAKKSIFDECNFESQEHNNEDEECYTKEPRTLSVKRCVKIQSLFQHMFYLYHSGKHRTPLHIMNAIWAHSLGHGGAHF